MRDSHVASAIVCLVAAVAVTGCDAAPLDPAEGTLGPEAAVQRNAPLKPGTPVLESVGPVPDVWVEPTDDLIEAVETGGLAVTGVEMVRQVMAGLDLVVNPCWDVGDLELRVAVVEDGEVTARASSDAGVLLVADGDQVVVGGSGGGNAAGGQGECRSPGTRTRYTGGDPLAPDDAPDWGVSGLDITELGLASTSNPDLWVQVGELIPGPRARGAWPAKWSFLKAKKAFLKAKKAFVPAAAVFAEAGDWFDGEDRPVLASGGFAAEGPMGPSFDGPVVVVGVMPGDNVSVMPGDRVAPEVGVTFVAFGPADD